MLGGKAKAMVVTWSRPMASAFILAMADYIKQRRYHAKSWSHSPARLTWTGREVTEAEVNGARGTTTELFDSDEKRIIVCANKFQTGFDQPGCAPCTWTRCSPSSRRTNLKPPKSHVFHPWQAHLRGRLRKHLGCHTRKLLGLLRGNQLDAATDPDVIYNLIERLRTATACTTPRRWEAVAAAYFDEPDPGAVLRKIEPKLSARRGSLAGAR